MTVARIRPAHGGDAEAIHTHLLNCWQEAYSPHLPQWMFDKFADEGLSILQQELMEPEGMWIAHRDDQAVGFAHALAAGPGQVRPLELAKLYVRESEYGKGTADNLLQISIGDAPCLTWVADYNTRAQRFYTKVGFEFDEGPDAKQVNRQWPGVALLRMVR